MTKFTDSLDRLEKTLNIMDSFLMTKEEIEDIRMDELRQEYEEDRREEVNIME